MDNRLSIINTQFKINKNKLLKDFISNQNPYHFFNTHTKLVKFLLTESLDVIINNNNVALIATGGFGRNELYPYSDIDIALIYEDQDFNTDLKTKITTFIQYLWDIGLTPSVQIGNIEELKLLAKNDLPIDTSFLESNFITGNYSLFEKFFQKINNQRNLINFIEGKKLELEIRNEKNQGTATQLEPNIKIFSGLRDIHTFIWMAKAIGMQINANYFTKEKIITISEYRELLLNHTNLARIRILLHIIAKKHEDRLLFDYQIEVAKKMGFKDNNVNLLIEKLMRFLYKSSNSIKQLSTILIPILISKVYFPYPRNIYKIDDIYYKLDNNIGVNDTKIFKKDPTQIFRILELLQRNEDISDIAPVTLRAWRNASKYINTKFKQNPINQQIFIGFFKYKKSLIHILRILNLYGILDKYINNFANISGLLQNDLFHIYPVDEHIIMVAKFIRRMDKEIYYDELPFLSSLMSNFEPKYILYLSALFHDIAKGRNGDHDILGASDAEEFAKLHKIPQKESDLLIWLVKNHLFMSTTAQKKDIFNPSVITEFCKIVDTPTKLTGLYILTVADIRGTNPKIWNTWKENLLFSLYELAYKYLKGMKYDNETLKQEKIDLLKKISQKNNIANVNEILKKLGDTYLLKFTSEEISNQLNLIINNMDQSSYLIRKIENSNNLELIIYTFNEKNLFFNICSYVAYISLSIVRARAFNTKHNFILDTFILEIPENFNNQYDKINLIKKLSNYMDNFILKKEPIKSVPLVNNITSRRAKYMPIYPKISLTHDYNDLLGDFYVLTIITTNKQSLLAQIAKVITTFNIDIKNAIINTLDQRVEDTFLLKSDKLDNTKTQLDFKTALLKIL